MPLLTKGAWMTLQVMLCSACISLFLGLIMGTVVCERLRIAFISQMIELLCFVLRAIPFYVQLLIVYFVLPDLLEIDLDSFTASIISLGICSSAYVSQLVRGALNSLPLCQWEAAKVLGYSRSATLRFVIFPQMVRPLLPALTNELDNLLKSTAILSSIGMLELTRVGMNIISREMQPLAIYLTIALFYIAISACINIVSKLLERRASRVNS